MTVTANKMRITLRAYDSGQLEVAAEEILDAAARTGAVVNGPVPLPTIRRRFAVIRSPHNYGASREYLEQRLHKRLIDITQPSAKTMDVLTRLSVPNGVEVSVKVMQ